MVTCLSDCCTVWCIYGCLWLPVCQNVVLYGVFMVVSGYLSVRQVFCMLYCMLPIVTSMSGWCVVWFSMVNCLSDWCSVWCI